MPKKNWTKKDERQYKAIVKKCSVGKKNKKATAACKRIAAATVNKRKGLSGRGKAWEAFQMPKTLTQLKQMNKHCGRHFFEPATMRFFKSKLYAGVVPCKSARCALFVTSEQGPHGPRAFSVRKAEGCDIETVGSFMEYKTESAARAAAKQAAARL